MHEGSPLPKRGGEHKRYNWLRKLEIHSQAFGIQDQVYIIDGEASQTVTSETFQVASSSCSTYSVNIFSHLSYFKWTYDFRSYWLLLPKRSDHEKLKSTNIRVFAKLQNLLLFHQFTRQSVYCLHSRVRGFTLELNVNNWLLKFAIDSIINISIL